MTSFARAPWIRTARHVATGTLAAALCTTMATGCFKEVEPAPEGLREIAKWTLRNAEIASDDELTTAVLNLKPDYTELTAAGPTTGGLRGRISVEDLTLLPEERRRDPQTAVGLYMAGSFVCQFDTLLDALTDEDQMTLHPGVYTDYSRDYAVQPSAFLNGSVDVATWQTTYATEPVPGIGFTAVTNAALRRVTPTPGSGIKNMAVSWVWLDEPVDFGEDEHVFDHDYQIEVFWQYEDQKDDPDTADIDESNTVHHFYPVWRSATYVTGIGTFTLDEDPYLSLYLDALIKWDQDTQKGCQARDG